MRDPRDDIQLKIQWAGKHLEDFRAAVVEFRTANPYGFRVERDPKTREPVYYAVVVQDIPLNISLIAGDVIQNLRTALDYLACSLVLSNRKTPTRDTGFPVFDDVAKYQAGYGRKVDGMRQDAINAISAIKPYKGGDNTLWRLHRLNNVDKHRLLFTAETYVRAMTGQPVQKAKPFNPAEWDLTDFMAGFMQENWVGIPNAVPFPLKVGDPIFRDLPDAEINQDMKFFGEITLNEPGISVGEPLILILSSSLRRVRRIANDFVIHLL